MRHLHFPLGYPICFSKRRDVMEIRKLVLLPQEMWDAIQDWRFKHRINSSSEAIRRLISIGLLQSLKEDISGKITHNSERPAA